MKNKYRITSHMFNGRTVYGKDNESYSYTWTLNRSLEHMGKHCGIEAGLNMYTTMENSKGIKRWILNKIINYFK